MGWQEVNASGLGSAVREGPHMLERRETVEAVLETMSTPASVLPLPVLEADEAKLRAQVNR